MGTGRHEVRAVPGYELLERQKLTAGEHCLARELTAGALVQLHLLPQTRDADVRREVSDRVDRLARVRSPHLVSVRQLLEVDEELVLVSDPPPRAVLADLVAQQPLTAGQVVTVACGVAAALSALATEGLAHGGVAASAVRLTRAGRPVLAGAGAAALGLPAPAPPGPYRDPFRSSDAATEAGDVYALAALCLVAVAGSLAPPRRPELPAGIPEPWLAAVTSVLDADPGARPDAAGLAAALRAAVTPEPIRGAYGPPAPHLAAPHLATEGDLAGRLRRQAGGGADGRRQQRRPAAGRRAARAAATPRARSSRRAGRRPPTWMLACLLMGGMSAAGAYALVSPGQLPAVHGQRSVATGEPVRPVPEPNWREVLGRLDARRAAAFAQGDAAALAEIYSPVSGAGVRDLAALGAVRSRGLRARGMRQTLVEVRVLTASMPGEARLEVVDRLPEVQLLDRAGRVRERRPARGPVRWVITLEGHKDSAWRIRDVQRPPPDVSG